MICYQSTLLSVTCQFISVQRSLFHSLPVTRLTFSFWLLCSQTFNLTWALAKFLFAPCAQKTTSLNRLSDTLDISNLCGIDNQQVSLTSGQGFILPWLDLIALRGFKKCKVFSRFGLLLQLVPNTKELFWKSEVSIGFFARNFKGPNHEIPSYMRRCR